MFLLLNWCMKSSNTVQTMNTNPQKLARIVKEETNNLQERATCIQKPFLQFLFTFLFCSFLFAVFTRFFTVFFYTFFTAFYKAVEMAGILPFIGRKNST